MMTSKVEPGHVEPCRPITGSYIVFSARLAVSVALSIPVLYDHISIARTQCEMHYSGCFVAETHNSH